MDTITLGQNGPAVTPLCLGTWAWGDKLFWNYGSDYGEAQLQEAYMAALEAGVTFFDTAEIYGFGVSEQLLAKFRQHQPVQIATKYGPLPWRFSAQSVSEGFDREPEAPTVVASRFVSSALALQLSDEPGDVDECLGR